MKKERHPFVQWLGELWCVIFGGHYYLLELQEAGALRCMHCDKRTPGFRHQIKTNRQRRISVFR